MRDRFQRWLPKPEALAGNRWLRWMGPRILHPRLWHVSRRGIALGCAIGIFFGLLIPIAQIPMAAVFAVVCRANVAAAVASTLVTNPVTFAPVYYAAWRVGHRILGGQADAVPPAWPGLSPQPAAGVNAGATTGARTGASTHATAGPMAGVAASAPTRPRDTAAVPAPPTTRPGTWWARTLQQLRSVGKPLALGLVIFATGFGLLVWVVIHAAWWLLVHRKRRQRLRRA